MPQRRCVGCGLVRDASALLRFAARDGHLVIDRKAGFGGRGAYLCPDKNCFEVAYKRKGVFTRALKVEVEIPDEEEFFGWADGRAK